MKTEIIIDIRPGKHQVVSQKQIIQVTDMGSCQCGDQSSVWDLESETVSNDWYYPMNDIEQDITSIIPAGVYHATGKTREWEINVTPEGVTFKRQ